MMRAPTSLAGLGTRAGLGGLGGPALGRDVRLNVNAAVRSSQSVHLVQSLRVRLA